MPIWLRWLLVFLAVVAIGLGSTWYVQRRASRAYGLSRRVGRGVLIALLLTGPGLALYSRIGPGGALAWTVGSSIVLSTLITAVLLLGLDLLRGAYSLGTRALTRMRGKTEEAPAEPGVGRREVVLQLGVAAAGSVGFGSSGYGAIFGRHDYETDNIAIPIDGLSPRLDGYKIAQISDIHIGAFVGEHERRAAVELMRDARADLIVMTGDLVDHDPAYAPELGRWVRQLVDLRPRHGVIVIPGNHEHYTGVDLVLDTARRAGAEVLRNQARTIGDAGGAFSLLGVDYGEDTDLARAEAMAQPGLPRILLCHDPSFFPNAHGRVALQLSGHTHGGQVSPIGINPAHLVLRYVRGLYVENGTRLYVNRGFGTAGPPVRVGSPPEITVVSLTA